MSWHARSLSKYDMRRFGDFRHILYLPGGADWSSSLNQLMAYGSTLVMPGDMDESCVSLSAHS